MAIRRSGSPSLLLPSAYHFLLVSYYSRLAHLPRLAILTLSSWPSLLPAHRLPVIVWATSSGDSWEVSRWNGWNNPGLANALSLHVPSLVLAFISNGAVAGPSFSVASSFRCLGELST